MKLMNFSDSTGSARVLMEVTNESYSGDRPMSKVKTRSESVTKIAIAARLSMMDLTDWMYSDIEEVSILTVCSWYLSCCTLVLESDTKICSRELHTSRDVVRPTT